MSRPTAIVYVDGFNLYRRSLEGRPGVKWLNLFTLAQCLLPELEVLHVHFFTALLRQGLLADDRAPSRQNAYLRALSTENARITQHFGKFQNDPRWMPAHPQQLHIDTREFVKVRVRKLEEKRSDVNLAGRMIADACHGRADVLVLLSNDSDQVGTMNLVKHELGVKTGIIFPLPSIKAAKELVGTRPDFLTHVSVEALLQSQFPAVMKDATGEFHCPPSWV